MGVAGVQAVGELPHHNGLPSSQDEQEPQIPVAMVLHSMNLWLHSEVKCTEEEEGECRGGVGQVRVVPAGGHQQPRQQAANHAYILRDYLQSLALLKTNFSHWHF